MNSCLVVLHPFDVGLVVGGVRPYSHNFRGKVLVSISEGGLLGADPSPPLWHRRARLHSDSWSSELGSGAGVYQVPLSRGSRTSRRASPSRFQANTTMAIAKPGNTPSHGARCTYV